MRIRPKKQEVDNVDVSPLIDMVFILLIFFMVTTTFVKDMKLDLERPSAASASKSDAKVVRVYIDNTSQVYIDNQPVQLWAIQARRFSSRNSPIFNAPTAASSTRVH